MAVNPLKYTAIIVDDMLKSKGYEYLNVLVRGNNIVVYNEEMGEKVNRFRLTQIKPNLYMLCMADHKGKWESTPFEGTPEELVSIVINKFPFTTAMW